MLWDKLRRQSAGPLSSTALPAAAQTPATAGILQATKQGAVLAFEVEGGRDAAWRVIDACSLISITANLGDTKSTITHPASTTHARLSQPERDAAGICEGLVRVAVGLESLDDIKADLQLLTSG
jgi:O-succinylhomoserine sulfhydrylase